MAKAIEKAREKTGIRESTQEYEDWLAGALDHHLVEADLKEKHKKMRADAFSFLRATFWRWAETIPVICSELADGPEVLAVGDIHLENFGVWRDAEGRLTWGVNDFDEAADMPYALDLARLAVSATLVPGPWQADATKIGAMILAGYKQGLNRPAAFVLDREHDWLREQFAVDRGERAAFWHKIEKQRTAAEKQKCKPEEPYRSALKQAMPAPVKGLEFWARSAGTGSLGRPRWVAYGEWRGAPVLREAKAIVASAWTLVAKGNKDIRCLEIANGKFHAPDACYDVKKNPQGDKGHTAIRRLSPNSRKLEVAEHGAILLDPRMLHLMGHDLANVHLGTAPDERADDIRKHLKSIERGFAGAVQKATQRVLNEHAEWKYAKRDD